MPWSVAKGFRVCHLRKSTFLIGGGGGGGGPGLRRGVSLVIFLQIGEGQTCFILNLGRVIVFFGKEKITPCRFYFVYTSKSTSRDLSKLFYRCRKIYLSKNYLLSTNIIVSLDPCTLSFRPYSDVSARGSGIKSIPVRIRHLSYSNLNLHLDLLHHYIRPLGSGTTLGLHLSTSLYLCFHLFSQPMCHQLSQRSSGHPL